MAVTHIYVCTTCKLADEAGCAASDRSGARLHRALSALASERDQLWARVGAADFLSVEEKRALLGLQPGPSA